jgi:hypothetical protein
MLPLYLARIENLEWGDLVSSGGTIVADDGALQVKSSRRSHGSLGDDR